MPADCAGVSLFQCHLFGHNKAGTEDEDTFNQDGIYKGVVATKRITKSQYLMVKITQVRILMASAKGGGGRYHNIAILITYLPQ